MSQEKRLKIFNPSDLIESFTKSGLDTTIFEAIDETSFRKAPNFLTFVVDPEFLNATILPKQIEMGTKLFADYCPVCSEPDFIDNLYDQDIGTIRKKVVFLEHGKCPECYSTRFEFFQQNRLSDYNEFAGCLGQRCIPESSLVFTQRGLIPMRDIEKGDIVSHGMVTEVYDSGSLDLRVLNTELGWLLRGARKSHIVPVLMDDWSIQDKPIRDIVEGDFVLICTPDIWPSLPPVKHTGQTQYPYKFDQMVCGFLGMVCRNYSIQEDGTMTISTKYHETLHSAFLDLFGMHVSFENESCTIHDKQFIKWFLDFTESKKIPREICTTTKEAAEAFVLYYMDKDWYESEDGTQILRHIIEEDEDIESLKLLMLNLGMLTCVRQLDHMRVLMSVHFVTEDENLLSLINRGYYPTQVIGIDDLGPVPMRDLTVSGTNLYCADGFMHHNSGKSKFIGLVSNYMLHRMLCIPNPIRFFNQSAGDIFGMSFAGLSEEKVEKNLWSAFIGFMDASPWFQKYHAFLEDKGRELKQEILTRRKSFISYNHKKILCDYYGSKGTSLRGDTRFFGSIDEIGWMSSGLDAKGASMMNADSIYTSINNSLSTLRMKRSKILNENNYDVPPILIANISSPSSSKDKIMKQVKASKTNSKIYAVQLPTWQSNPDYTEDKLWAEFSSMDPMEFYRDFGASPPIESNPYISETNTIDRIAIGGSTDLYSFKIEKDVDSLGDKFLYGKLVKNRPDNMTPRLLAFDLGSTNNAFGMMVFKMDKESRPILESGLIIKPRDGYKLNLPRIYEEVTVPMVENYGVKYVFFDKWQSLDQVSRLRDKGIDAQVYSLKYADMDGVRGMVTSRGVIIPKLQNPMGHYLSKWLADDEYIPDEIAAALGIQLLTVRDTGIRFLKPTSGDDDLFRAFALGVNRLSDIRVIKGMTSPLNQSQGMNNGGNGGGIGVSMSRKGSASTVVSSGVGVTNSLRR